MRSERETARLTGELEALESKLGVCLIAYDVENDEIIYGEALVDELERADEAGVDVEVLGVPAVISDRDAAVLQTVEDAFTVRLVGYHPLSDSVVWGQDLITALAGQHGITD